MGKDVCTIFEVTSGCADLFSTTASVSVQRSFRTCLSARTGLSRAQMGGGRGHVPDHDGPLPPGDVDNDVVGP